jgi:hypothetical protein
MNQVHIQRMGQDTFELSDLPLLWWQQREFPKVWTSESLATCVEKGCKWSVNSTIWNHLQAMWKGPSLDLLCQVYEEIQHQDRIEACGYRSATWRILRALKSINGAKVMAGESAITPAPFFEVRDGHPKTFEDHSKTTSNTGGEPKCRGKGGES